MQIFMLMKQLWSWFFSIIRKTSAFVVRERNFLLLLFIISMLASNSSPEKLQECQKKEGVWFLVFSFYRVSPDIDCMDSKKEDYGRAIEIEIKKGELEILKTKQEMELVIEKEKQKGEIAIEAARMEAIKEILKSTIPVMVQNNGAQSIMPIIEKISGNASAISNEHTEGNLTINSSGRAEGARR